MIPQTLETKIAIMKAWCLKHYEEGADTMVECWDTETYAYTLADCNYSFMEAMRTIRNVASAYADRQADAKNCW